jgi:hypothetical protein
MGRRSRQRVTAEPPAGAGGAPVRPEAPPQPRTPRLRAPIEEAPPAPWHPFPLVELAIFAGIVLIVAGVVSGGNARPILLFGGLVLISIAALELTIREHFSGYRSHSALLAAVVGIGAAVPLWWTPLPQPALIVVAVAVWAVAFRSLRSLFVRRSGGLAWRA